MFTLRFVIKGIDRDGREVLASGESFSSLYMAELHSLDFYGDPRFKTVWVEQRGSRPIPAVAPAWRRPPAVSANPAMCASGA